MCLIGEPKRLNAVLQVLEGMYVGFYIGKKYKIMKNIKFLFLYIFYSIFLFF